MKQIKRGILSFAAVLILWQLLITLTHVSSALFPAPLDVVNAFRELAVNGLKGSTSPLPLICLGALGRFRSCAGP